MARELFKVSIVGLKELEEALNQLHPKIRKRIATRTLKKALEPVYDETVRRVPVGETGRLAAGIKMTSTNRNNTHRADVVSRAPHSHLVEFGHRMVSRHGLDTGKFVPGKPFMRPAWDNNTGKILTTIEKDLRDELARHAKRSAASFKRMFGE